ncbi:hypothetical protein [Actinopolyspora saharensis]|uniref:hypothetical protein n=1 Tax=Actinopolyspora saharensis TaxID=995062 RepID=UPI003F6676C7
MNMHARIELFGGPEDGREITLPVSAEGEPLSPLPVPAPRNSGEDEGVAWYERDHHRGRGMWIYRYANSRSPRQSELP